MKQRFVLILLYGVLLASCSKNEHEITGNVFINFTAKALSNTTIHSSISEKENAITKIAIFGINANGEVTQTFPLINNPQPTGIRLPIHNEVKTIVVIANPTDDMVMDYSCLSEIRNALIDLSNVPSMPFVMTGEAEVNSNSINIELVRNIAKIEVKGMNGFDVNSITVIKTPKYGYFFTGIPISSFTESDYTEYPEQNGSVVYVGENSKNIPTRLLVKGNYNNAIIVYTITLMQNLQPIDVVRNTAYEISIVPLTVEECEVFITVPDWNDLVADDKFIPDFGTYYTVDFHQHTTLTDGSFPMEELLEKGWQYGVDFMVNSEHGGFYNGMWRWRSIRYISFPKIKAFNQRRTPTVAIQGLEWNTPGYGHCTSGVITGQFDTVRPNASAMAQFEYMFDSADKDITGGQAQGWTKSTFAGHEKSMEAAAWLQTNHQYNSWLVAAHPERADVWKIEHYRDLNDIAPDVFVAFEGAPGHQANSIRGKIDNVNSYKNSYTLGGMGIQAAKIGDLWDALLSEGRRFWMVVNSDFHSHASMGGTGFYPGEYQKTYISMKNKTAQGFIDGLRSGNIFCVHGDLIDRLEFSVGNVTMGQTFITHKHLVKVRILVHNPETPNNNE
jgi:hypothetical protein